MSQSNGRVRHEWEGLRVLKDGPSFAATKGNGMGRLNISGASMNVELVGERVPGLPWEVGAQGGGGPGAAKREGEDDDEWTLVQDEDGDPELTRRPPPTYDEAMRR